MLPELKAIVSDLDNMQQELDRLEKEAGQNRKAQPAGQKSDWRGVQRLLTAGRDYIVKAQKRVESL